MASSPLALKFIVFEVGVVLLAWRTIYERIAASWHSGLVRYVSEWVSVVLDLVHHVLEHLLAIFTRVCVYSWIVELLLFLLFSFIRFSVAFLVLWVTLIR